MARVSKGASRRAQKRELEKKTVNMQPIDRVASKVKQAVEHEGLSCIVYAADANGQFAGGLVGDPVRVADALYNSAKENKAVYVILEAVVKSLKANGYAHEETEGEGEEEATFGVAESEKGETRGVVESLMLSELHGRGEISAKLFNMLSNEGMNTLEDLSEHKAKEVESIRGMGKMTFHELRAVMHKYNVKFLTSEVEGV